jgi:hypothetical protein
MNDLRRHCYSLPWLRDKWRLWFCLEVHGLWLVLEGSDLRTSTDRRYPTSGIGLTALGILLLAQYLRCPPRGYVQWGGTRVHPLAHRLGPNCAYAFLPKDHQGYYSLERYVVLDWLIESAAGSQGRQR